MAVECTCAKCASRYRVDDRFLGKKVRCKKCGDIILVSASTDDAIQLDDIAALATESVSDMSAVGRSAAGKSAAGKSAVGRSRVATLPPGMQQQSVIFEREDDLVSAPVTYAPRKPTRGVETPFISDQLAGLLSIIALLLYLALTGYISYVGYQQNTAARPDLLDKLGMAATLNAAAGVVGFLVLLVPAVVVAVAIGSGIDKRNSPPLDLIRAAGVGALVYSCVMGFLLIGGRDAASGGMMIVIGIVVSFIAIRELMQLRTAPAALAWGIFLVLGTLAFVGSMKVQGKTVAWYIGDTTPPPAQEKPKPKPANPTPTVVTQAPSNPTPAAVDPYAASLKDLIPRIDQRLTETKDLTREQLVNYWQAQIDHFGKLTPREDSALYVQYAERITKIKALIAAAPSAEAPPEVFAALEGPAEMSNTTADLLQLGSPVKFGPVIIMPLKNAKLDLTKFASRATTVSWTLDKVQGNPRVTLTLIPRRQATQTRPWLTTNKSVQAMAESKGFYVLDMPSPLETVVKIGGMTLSRLSPDPATAPITERRIYAGVIDDQFLELSITHDLPGDKLSLDQMEMMARSLHLAATGETAADAYDPAAIVARFDDDFEHAAPVIESIGEPAEDAVLAWAKASGKPPTPAVTALLRKIGTRKSAAFLASFSGTPGTMVPGGMGMPPKPIEKPIIPAATVLEKFDLEVSSIKKNDMLESLTRQTPGDNKAEIAKLLEGILLSPGNEQYLTHAAKALAIWHRPETVAALLPMLDEHINQDAYRRAAMTALAGTHDPKCVVPIKNWMALDSEHTTECLIAMGPVAEVETIKLLGGNFDYNVRNHAARVLKEIGTVKSIVPLRSATLSTDPIHFTAQEALDAVAARRAAGGH